MYTGQPRDQKEALAVTHAAQRASLKTGIAQMLVLYESQRDFVANNQYRFDPAGVSQFDTMPEPTKSKAIAQYTAVAFGLTPAVVENSMRTEDVAIRDAMLPVLKAVLLAAGVTSIINDGIAVANLGG